MSEHYYTQNPTSRHDVKRLNITLDGKVLSFDTDATNTAIGHALVSVEHAVIPGFYGAMPDGTVHTFSRGGSDITGSVVARAAGADLYENFTDVSGFFMTDPRIVENPRRIDVITYAELREMNKQLNIPLAIKNYGQGGVIADEHHIVQLLPHPLFHGQQQTIRHPFHRHKELVRMGGSGLHRKGALAAADLQTERTVRRQPLPPAAPHGIGVFLLDSGTALHTGDQVFLFTHSHSRNLNFFSKHLPRYHTTNCGSGAMTQVEFSPRGREPKKVVAWDRWLCYTIK